jgi:hypothetical protein
MIKIKFKLYEKLYLSQDCTEAFGCPLSLFNLEALGGEIRFIKCSENLYSNTLKEDPMLY